MGSRMAGLAVALAASVALNAWLWSRGGARAESHEARTVEDVAVDHAPADRSAADAPAHDDPACPHDLLDASAHAATLQHQLDGVLDLDEKFKDAEPNEALETRLHDRFAKAFVGAPEGLTWQLECRAHVCRIEVLQRAGQPMFQLGLRLPQEPALRGLIRSGEFTAGEPVKDPVSREKLLDFDSYQDVGDPDGVLEPIANAFQASDGLRQCKAQHPDWGWIALRLDLALGATTIETSLLPPRDDFGACALAALSALASAAHPSASAYDAQFAVIVTPPATGATP
jgi:hypothetical protein